MDDSEIARKLSVDPSIIQLLRRGANKDDLHQALGQAMGKTSVSPEVDVARMNLIGGLRALGFTVTGGRGGGKIYQITAEGGELVQSKGGIETWPDVAKERLALYRSQTRVGLHHRDMIDGALDKLESNLHENSFGYLWSYELARDQGFICTIKQAGSTPFVFIQRFFDKPRFRIFDLGNPPEYLLTLAENLSFVSTKPVPIVNLTKAKGLALRKLHPKGELWPRKEAVVDVTWVLDHQDEIFSKHQRSGLRKSFKELSYGWGVSGPTYQAEMMVVFESWKRLNLHKHRQPSMTRDEIAITDPGLVFRLLVRRETDPVSIILGDLVKGNHGTTASLLVEKSLNYTTYPDETPVRGGHSGTTDASMIAYLTYLWSLRIKWLNMGAYEGGGVGLPAHKLRYANPANDATHYTFKTKFSSRGDDDGIE